MRTCQEKYSCMFWHISLFFYPSRYNPYTIEVQGLFNVWVTENRIRAILPVYMSYILDLSGMFCSPYPAGLGRLPSHGSHVVMGSETGQPQHPPEQGLGVWVLQLRSPSSSHWWDITLISWMLQDFTWEAVLVQIVKMFPFRLGCNNRGESNCSSCIEGNMGTAPHQLFWCNKVMWEGRRKSTWLHKMSYDGTIWTYCKRHGHA